jgi:tetratricopeptide (TPR) repeat protein
MLLMNLGLINSELGAPDRALEYLERATTIADSLNDPVLRRDVQSITGTVYTDRKDYQRALVCYEKAWSLDRATGNANKIAMDLGNIGVNKVALGRRSGMGELRQSIAMAESLNAQIILWKGMLNLADAYEVFDDLDSARVVNQRTIQIMESIQIGNLGEDERGLTRRREATHRGSTRDETL